MGDTPHPFADKQTLEIKGPVCTGTSRVIGKVTCQFGPLIQYGQTANTKAWKVITTGGPVLTTNVTITGGRIVVQYLGFQTAVSIEFQGPPPIFRAVDKGILESFTRPVPYP